MGPAATHAAFPTRQSERLLAVAGSASNSTSHQPDLHLQPRRVRGRAPLPGHIRQVPPGQGRSGDVPGAVAAGGGERPGESPANDPTPPNATNQTSIPPRPTLIPDPLPDSIEGILSDPDPADLEDPPVQAATAAAGRPPRPPVAPAGRPAAVPRPPGGPAESGVNPSLSPTSPSPRTSPNALPVQPSRPAVARHLLALSSQLHNSPGMRWYQHDTDIPCEDVDLVLTQALDIERRMRQNLQQASAEAEIAYLRGLLATMGDVRVALEADQLRQARLGKAPAVPPELAPASEPAPPSRPRPMVDAPHPNPQIQLLHSKQVSSAWHQWLYDGAHHSSTDAHTMAAWCVELGDLESLAVSLIPHLPADCRELAEDYRVRFATACSYIRAQYRLVTAVGTAPAALSPGPAQPASQLPPRSVLEEAHSATTDNVPARSAVAPVRSAQPQSSIPHSITRTIRTHVTSHTKDLGERIPMPDIPGDGSSPPWLAVHAEQYTQWLTTLAQFDTTVTELRKESANSFFILGGTANAMYHAAQKGLRTTEHRRESGKKEYLTVPASMTLLREAAQLLEDMPCGPIPAERAYTTYEPLLQVFSNIFSVQMLALHLLDAYERSWECGPGGATAPRPVALAKLCVLVDTIWPETLITVQLDAISRSRSRSLQRGNAAGRSVHRSDATSREPSMRRASQRSDAPAASTPPPPRYAPPTQPPPPHHTPLIPPPRPPPGPPPPPPAFPPGFGPQPPAGREDRRGTLIRPPIQTNMLASTTWPAFAHEHSIPLGTPAIDFGDAPLKETQTPQLPSLAPLALHADVPTWRAAHWQPVATRFHNRRDLQAETLINSLDTHLRNYLLTQVQTLPPRDHADRVGLVTAFVKHWGAVEFMWHVLLNYQPGAVEQRHSAEADALRNMAVSATGHNAQSMITAFLTVADNTGHLLNHDIRIKYFVEMFATCPALYNEIHRRPKDMLPPAVRGLPSGVNPPVTWMVQVHHEQAADRFALLLQHATERVTAHLTTLKFAPRQQQPPQQQGGGRGNRGNWWQKRTDQQQGHPAQKQQQPAAAAGPAAQQGARVAPKSLGLAAADTQGPAQPPRVPPTMAQMRERLGGNQCIFCGKQGHPVSRCRGKLAYDAEQPVPWEMPPAIVAALREAVAARRQQHAAAVNPEDHLPGGPAVPPPPPLPDQRRGKRRHPQQGDNDGKRGRGNGPENA